jgi:hypothetical protein
LWKGRSEVEEELIFPKISHRRQDQRRGEPKMGKVPRDSRIEAGEGRIEVEESSERDTTLWKGLKEDRE